MLRRSPLVTNRCRLICVSLNQKLNDLRLWNFSNFFFESPFDAGDFCQAIICRRFLRIVVAFFPFWQWTPDEAWLKSPILSGQAHAAALRRSVWLRIYQTEIVMS